MKNITVTKEVRVEDIENLLVSAFEGGSNYWYMIQATKEPKTWSYWGYSNDKTKVKHLPLYPINGGALVINDEVGSELLKKPVVLNASRLKKGMQVMADKYPHHFADVLKEYADQTTGDVFLQCCIFGEIVYG